MLAERVLDDRCRKRMVELEVTPVDVHPGQKVSRVKFFSGATLEPLSKHLLVNDTMWISSLGYMSYSSSHLMGAVVGRYCSISGHIRLMGDNHPTDWVTSHVFAYGPKYRGIMHRHGENDWDARAPVLLKPATLTIGNDVWIGRDAVLARGIKIGDGAIIAGSAVVTKDVPPYAVVGGVPAKIIRYRFSDHIIERLRTTQWWNYRMSSYGKVKFNDVERFLDEFLSMPLRKLPDCRFPLENFWAEEIKPLPIDTWL